jgi:hypothetical protein
MRLVRLLRNLSIYLVSESRQLSLECNSGSPGAKHEFFFGVMVPRGNQRIWKFVARCHRSQGVRIESNSTVAVVKRGVPIGASTCYIISTATQYRTSNHGKTMGCCAHLNYSERLTLVIQTFSNLFNILGHNLTLGALNTAHSHMGTWVLPPPTLKIPST